MDFGVNALKKPLKPQFCCSLWAEKDERLERFYAEPIWSKRRLEPSAGTEGNVWAQDGWWQVAIKLFGFCFWLSVVPVWLFHLSFLPFVQVCCFWHFY